jgi:hypothetical protein
VLRLIGNASLHIGTLLEQLYDLPLFVPLWLEQRMGQEAGGKGRPAVSRGAQS